MSDSKFLKFMVIGIINTIIGSAIMFGLYNLAGCSYWVSSASNYVLVSILSYVLNRKYTFGYNGRVIKSFARFSFNIAICYFFAYGAAKPLVSYMLQSSSLQLKENAAMFAGMIIFTLLNYTGQKFFVFGDLDK